MLRLRFKACMTVVAALLFMLPGMALADGSISLTAQILLEGTLPVHGDVFTVEIVGQEEDAPMPAGSHEQAYRASRTGAGSLSLGEITCIRPGYWNYTVCQIPSDADCTYDLRQYELQISAYSRQDGGLDVVATLHSAGSDEKLEDIRFVNSYPVSEDGTLTPTGVEDHWMYYAGGAVILLLIALWLIGLLRRRRDEE